MKRDFSRRKLIEAAAVAALAPAAAPAATMPGPRNEGKDTPKICLESGAGGLSAGGADEAGMRRIKQLGVDHVLTGYAGRIPWEEAKLRDILDRFKAGGLTVGNIMISGFNNTIYG